MALLEQWQKVAYNEKADRGELQRFWQRYFLLEKGVYEKLLTNPDEKVEGTVKELADKYGLSIMDMTGFLDGINESLVEPNPIDTMEEDTKVSLYSTRRSCTRTWSTRRQTGSMSFRCGMTFLTRRRRRDCIWSRRSPERLSSERKSDATIRVRAVPARNTNFAVESKHRQQSAREVPVCGTSFFCVIGNFVPITQKRSARMRTSR